MSKNALSYIVHLLCLNKKITKIAKSTNEQFSSHDFLLTPYMGKDVRDDMRKDTSNDEWNE